MHDDYQSIFEQIIADVQYLQNLDWGRPRRGHPEGTVRAHIAELEGNLLVLRPRLSECDHWKLKILIHTHDSFKAQAEKGVRISHPQSHASLARSFLEKFCTDVDLLNMVQYHDEPYALWTQDKSKGSFNEQRLETLLATIGDWNLFSAFLIIDGCTAGKGREPLHWLFQKIAGRVESVFSEVDILESDN